MGIYEERLQDMSSANKACGSKKGARVAVSCGRLSGSKILTGPWRYEDRLGGSITVHSTETIAVIRTSASAGIFMERFIALLRWYAKGGVVVRRTMLRSVK